MATNIVSDRVFRFGTNNLPGESFIYINGLGVLQDEKVLLASAKKNAEDISKIIGNRQVVLFFNPTAFTNKPQLEKLSTALAQLICQEVTRCLSESPKTPRIRIVAHSHGTVLLRQAMSDPAVKTHSQHLTIAGFGGARLLPKSVARKVKNYINEKDPIPKIAMTKQMSGKLGEIEHTFKSEYLRDESHLTSTFTLRLQIAQFEYLLTKQGLFTPKGLNSRLSKVIVRDGLLTLATICKDLIEQHKGPNDPDVEEIAGLPKKYHVKILTSSITDPMEQHLISSYFGVIGEFLNR
jgi:hypothetical protein